MKHPTSGLDLGDCLDLLADARRIVELVQMAVRYAPDEDAKAIDAGLAAAFERFDAAKDGLEMLWEVNRPSQPGSTCGTAA